MYTVPYPTDFTGLRVIRKHGYALVRYTKPMLNPDLGVYRSVIFKGTTLVGFSPPRSTASAAWDHVGTEFIEGTMVNAFYDNGWKICTKSVIGADSAFIRGAPTFEQMFYEADAAGSMHNLDPTLAYSFVLQHPKNRIVYPVEHPKLWLIAAYRITGPTVDEVSVNTPFSRPPVVEASRVGVVYRGGAARCKVLTQEYMAAHELRGNSTSFVRHCIDLMRSGRINDFCRVFPDLEFGAFSVLRAVKKFKRDLYDEYYTEHIQRARSHRLFNRHRRALHAIYLKELRPLAITERVVAAYVDNLAPEVLEATILSGPYAHLSCSFSPR